MYPTSWNNWTAALWVNITCKRRARQLEHEVFALALQRMGERMRREARSNPDLAGILQSVAQRETDPLSAVRQVLTRVFSVEDDEV